MKNQSKISWTFLIILISLSNPVKADTVFISKGEPALFDGFLFDVEGGKKVKQRLIEAAYFESLSASLQTQVKLYEGIETRNNEKHTILMDRNNELSKNLNAERSMSSWEKAAWFAAGILTTTLVLYGVQRVAK